MLNKANITIWIAFLFLVTKGNFYFAQSQPFLIDYPASTITFNIKHLGVLNVDGVFKEFSATIYLDKETLKKIESTIQVKSIDTNDQKRDANLLEATFLDVETFPNITFYSNEITNKTIWGTLKIKAIEEDIKMPYSISTSDDEKHIISMSTVLSRKKFKLDFGSLNAILGDEIKVTIRIVMSRP